MRRILFSSGFGSILIKNWTRFCLIYDSQVVGRSVLPKLVSRKWLGRVGRERLNAERMQK